MNLARIQILSLATKAVTTVLGIIQSIIILRLLSPAQYGLVGLVMSIGGVIGVTQHLGIVDGAIREIAVLKDRREIGKVFWVSNLFRQLITLPLSIGLVLLAGMIAERVYGQPEIKTLLQIFSAVLILQGWQDVLGAALTGLKKFYTLYAVQVVTAALNVLIFWWFTVRWGMSGFFYAIIVTTTVMVMLLGAVIISYLGHNLALPSRLDLKQYGARIMRIGSYMYLARIGFVVWQRLPLLLLGGKLAADELGYLNISQTFGSKLTIIAMALSEVNLSLMSSLFAHDNGQFIKVVTKNIQRVLLLMLGLTASLLFFVPEILRYIIGTQYQPAQSIIIVMTLAYFLYALLDISTSSTFVPADQPRLRAIIYGSMTVISAGLIGLLLWAKPDPILSAWAVLTGVAIAYGATVLMTKKLLRVSLLTWPLLILLIVMFGVVLWLLAEPSLVWRTAVFLFLMAVVAVQSQKSQLLPDWRRIIKPDPKEKTHAKHLSSSPIIIFAGAFFDQPIWTNRQHVAARLAAKHPVLYIEPRHWIVKFIFRHASQPKNIWRLIKRILYYEDVQIPQIGSLHVKAQFNLIPGSRENRIIARLNHQLNRWNVLFWSRRLGFLTGRGENSSPGRPIVLIYDTEAAEYLADLDDAFIVYDCVDNHAAQAGADRNPQRVDEEEKYILIVADLVTVTSRRLYNLNKNRHKNVHLVPQAGDVQLYSQASVTAWPFTFNPDKPVIGSVGTLDKYKYDFDLLYSLARQKPEWNFALIGQPIIDQPAGELKRLRELPNVHLLGQIQRELVPAYVQHFSVCIIPYLNNAYNQASFPLKFWEFMASGRPVVVSGLPELMQYASLIGYANTSEEFTEEIEQALLKPGHNKNERQALAQKHSWEKRVSELWQLIENNMGNKEK